MNERIEQQVKQFAEDFMQKSGYDMRDFEPFLVESRLFAEKIVRECAQFVEDKFDFIGDEIVVKEKMLEHFGVE